MSLPGWATFLDILFGHCRPYRGRTKQCLQIVLTWRLRISQQNARSSMWSALGTKEKTSLFALKSWTRFSNFAHRKAKQIIESGFGRLHLQTRLKSNHRCSSTWTLFICAPILGLPPCWRSSRPDTVLGVFPAPLGCDVLRKPQTEMKNKRRCGSTEPHLCRRKYTDAADATACTMLLDHQRRT